MATTQPAPKMPAFQSRTELQDWLAHPKTRKLLLKVALRLTNGNYEDAEDLVQKALVRALRSLKQDCRNPRAWLLRTLRNLWIDTYRMDQRREQSLGELISLDAPLAGADGEGGGERQIPDLRSDNDPYQVVRSTRVLVAVLASDETKTPVAAWLLKLHDLPARRVAAELGCAPSDLSATLLHRACAKAQPSERKAVALTLMMIYGYAAKEVAAELGCKPGVLFVWKCRALAELAADLGHARAA